MFIAKINSPPAKQQTVKIYGKKGGL